MKLEFTFESGLEQLSDEKGRSSTNSGHLSNKSISISRSMDVTNSATNVGVQSPISPSADDLNLKIQSVKKVILLSVLFSIVCAAKLILYLLCPIKFVLPLL